MLSPTAAIAAQMNALQMNDWPDTDAGIRTAFLFSKPYGCETMIAGRVRKQISHAAAPPWSPLHVLQSALGALYVCCLCSSSMYRAA